MTRKVLIIGFEPIGRKEGMRLVFTLLGYELWSFNSDHKLMRIAARHFEMHELSVYGEAAVDDAVVDEKYLAALRRGIGIPVYHLRETPEIVGSVAYPIDEMVARFGDYFTNSISYMLALAIHELTPISGPTPEIHLYGIDMAREHENAMERPSIEYFLGYARGAGIKVVIPKSSDMLKCFGLYGYVDAYEFEAKMRERHERLLDMAASYNKQAAGFDGAADDTDYWLRRMLLPGDERYLNDATRVKMKERKKWLRDRAQQYVKALAAGKGKW